MKKVLVAGLVTVLGWALAVAAVLQAVAKAEDLEQVEE